MRSRRLAKAPLVIGVAALAAGSVAFAAQKARAPRAGDPVIATVNGEKIYRSELANQLLSDQSARLSAAKPEFVDRARPVAGAIGALVLKKMAANGGRPATVTRAEIVDFLFKDKKNTAVIQAVDRAVQERVIAQAAKARGIVLSPAEVGKKFAESIDTARKQTNLGGLSDQQVLSTLGFRRDFVRRNVVDYLLIEKLAKADLQKRLGHAIGPADFVDASHILIKVNTPDPKTADKAFADGEKRIKEIQAEINSGKVTFEDAALKYSDDSSKFQKGALGLFMRGQMVPEFDKAAFSQQPGKVGEPVKSAFGWHLIRVNRLGKDATPEEREKKQEEYFRTVTQGFMQKLMNEAKIVNKFSPQPQQQGMALPGR